jgi:hypothetical protein
MGSFSTYLQASQIHPQVVDWTKRVVKNGGALPGQKTVSAANNFYVSLITSNIVNQISMCNIVAPDNLVACMAPLIKTVGPDVWTNTNFISGDLTIDGLKGNGSSKFLNTTVKPSDYSSVGDTHIAIYCSGSKAGVPETEVGCADSGTAQDRLYLLYVDDNSYYFAGDAADVVAKNTTSSSLHAYMCGTSVNSTRNLYYAKSTIPHYSMASAGAPAGTNLPSVISIHVFCTNEVGSVGNYIAKRMSFVSLGKGLTSDQSSKYFSIIQALRREIGGGYV